MKAASKVKLEILKEYLREGWVKPEDIDLTTEQSIKGSFFENCDLGDVWEWLDLGQDDIEIPGTLGEHRWYAVNYYARQLSDGSWVRIPNFFSHGESCITDAIYDPLDYILDYISNLEVTEEARVIKVFKEVD